MKILYNIKFIFLSFVFLLSSCSQPRIQLEKESLTGQEYCVMKTTLTPTQNAQVGVLVLKSTKNPSKPSSLKATLTIAAEGREYDINPDEVLNLYIDGEKFKLDIIHSFKIAREEVEPYSVYLYGRSILLGTVKEVTRRAVSFFISQDNLSKILKAKSVLFEITVPVADGKELAQGYPIALELSQENIPSIKELKDMCTNHSLTKN